MQQQMRREYPAQIVEAGGSRKAFGQLVHYSAGCVAIRLSASNYDPPWMRPGAHVVVSAGAASGVNHMDGRVWTVDGGVAWLYVAKPGARPRARKSVRRACTMPVAIRWLRADCIAGPWLDATAVDVSIGGLGLTIPGAADITAKAEVRFLLPNEIEDAEAVDQASEHGSSAPTKQPVTAVCRPAFVRRLPGNVLLMGLEFASMKGQDRMRVAAFAHAGEPATRVAA